MSTHPVEPETGPAGAEPVAPNPTRLPIEPEFGSLEPAGDADEPGTQPVPT